MKYPMLQAHRGVSTDYPENTLSAFKGALYQGYKIIELDPDMTKDNKVVILHDHSLLRTARHKDGRKIEKDVLIYNITYEEALNYDYGLWFSNKFKGEKIPLLSEALEFAKENDLLVKIDNKIWRDDEKMVPYVFEDIKNSGARVAVTVNTVEFAKKTHKALPNAEIHYDGAYSEENLKILSEIIPSDKLVIWLALETRHNQWFKLGYANEEMCKNVKKVARLGLWILSDEKDYETAARWGADIVETTRALKPEIRKGYTVDTHTHSEHSHDSKCPISEMKKGINEAGADAFCVTDHCDNEFWETIDNHALVKGSVEDAKKENAKGDMRVFAGVEIGEGFWNKKEADEIAAENEYDEIIGSVHAVTFEGYTQPYSVIDFSKMDMKTVKAYMSQYFADVKRMIREMDFDLLSHLTCPLRYINGKYAKGLDCREYEGDITEILKMIIQRGIPLEINTSCKGSNYNEFMPEEWIVELYYSLGGRLITCASDAHISSNAAKAFDELKQMLKNHGFKYICYFENRFIYQCTL